LAYLDEKYENAKILNNNYLKRDLPINMTGIYRRGRETESLLSPPPTEH